MDTQTLMKEIALGSPNCARVLDTLGLNYCCDGGGKLGLEQACHNASQNPETVLACLEQAKNPTTRQEWDGISATTLIRHILATHHVFTRDQLAHLDIMLERLVRRHAEARPELIAIRAVLQDLRDDLLPHLTKEENILFPYIEALEKHQQEQTPLPPVCFGVIDNPIRQMESEHAEVVSLLQKLRQTTSDFVPPADLCTSYRIALQAMENLEADLLRHIRLENEVLFPQALALVQTV